MVIVYKWIPGITLHELRKQGLHDAFASLAAPLGSVCALIAKGDATEPPDLTAILDQCYQRLINGRARQRLGSVLSDRLLKIMEAREPELAWGVVSLSHGDLGHRNIIVHAVGERWRVNGVIDWETTTTGSALFDIGSLFRYSRRHDAAFIANFEKGYRSAGGDLPADWCRVARLLDVTWLIDVLDDEREVAALMQDCRVLVTQLIDDLR
jgi:hypothetical protein